MLARLLPTLALTVAALAQSSPEWTKPFPPFHIIGNIYWVGTWDLSTYLITTPQGHILINSGLAETVPQIVAGVEQLGFKVSDIKILTATHGHFDHVAGLATLQKATGAKVAMSERDVELLESGGKADFHFGEQLSARFEPVQVGQKLKDGDKIALGGTEITVHVQPGHTKGAASFTMDVREGGRTYKVAIVNMGSINGGVKVSGMPTYPGIAQDYARTFHDQKEMKVDVFLASHAAQFHLHEKYRPGDAYNPDRFVDPVGFRAAVDAMEKRYLDQLAAERGGR